MTLRGEELIGKEVIGVNGWKIGKSKDVIVTGGSSADAWKITYLDIELKGNIEEEIGLQGGPLAHYRLPIPISHVQGVGDVITLKTTKEEVLQGLRDVANARGATIDGANVQPQSTVTPPPG